ncbi:TonB-dependent receptor [Sphingobium aromaticivastans]|uniref:TonB-dependent receptor n=1 Tax=Sphingobium aromaticivastans TaxID=1778665 RepID=UPI00301AA79E
MFLGSSSSEATPSLRKLMAALLLGGSALCAPAIALAQDAAPQPAADTADIVVTARYKKEKLQEVPLSITALNADTLDKNGVNNVRDIAYLTSGMTIRSLGAEYGTRPIIRGQGDLSAGIGDPNVSVFIDGVYMFNSGTVNAAFVDLDRVEVVKGPVSALYGRNAASGAINYVTSRPGDQFAAKGKITGGTDGLFEAQGSVTVPVLPGKISLGFSGLYGKSDGTYKDKVNGERAGGYTKKDFRIAANVTPTEDITIFGAWYHGEDSFDLTPSASVTPNCGIAQGGNAANPGGLSNTVLSNYLFAASAKYCGAFNPIGEIQIPKIAAGATGNNRNYDLYTLNIAFDTPIGVFQATTGRTDVRVLRYNDFSGGVRDGYQQPIIPATLATQAIGTAAPQTITIHPFFGQDIVTSDWSQEVRMQSHQDQPFRWQFGGFMYAGRQEFHNNFGLIGTIPTGFAAATIAPVYTPTQGATLSRVLGLTAVISPTGALNPNNLSVSRAKFEQQAVFAGLEYDLAPGLTLSGEARRSWDRRRTQAISTFNFFAPTHTIGTLNAVRDFAYNNWRATAKYTIQPGAMVYASAATGTKAGGINSAQAAAGYEYEQGYEPETNNTYEVGGKFSAWGNKLQFNVAGFYIKSNGMQVNSTSNNPTNVGLIVKNLAGVTTKGFEFDTVLRPTKGVAFNAAVGFADPKIKNNTYQVYSANPTSPVAAAVTCSLIPSCADGLIKLPTAQNANPQNFNAVDLGGNQTPQVSKWQVTLGADFDGALTSELGWFVHGDYRYESKQYIDVENLSWLPERNLFNLRGGFTYGAARLTAFVDNITNNKTPEGAAYNTHLSDLTSTVLAGSLPTARQYGISLEYKF